MPKLDRNAAFNEAFGSEPKLDRAEAEKLAEDGGGLADAGREFVRGTYQLADSAMGMVDRSFLGDLARAMKGKPTSRDVDPIVTNFLRLPKAEQERISSEYLNAGTPMQDAQAYFKNAADEWAKKRSPSLQAAEDYTQQGDGVVDIVTRYAEEPSALAGALIRNLPQMLPMLAVRKAPISAQANIGTFYQGGVGAQQARDQSLTDAKQSGASATDTVNAAQTAEDVGGAVSTFAGLFGARGDVAALNAITGRSLAPILAGGKKELLKQPALNAVEEFIDEAGSPLGANIGAQKTYDPTRDTMQNVVNQGTHGALVGGPMGIAQGASMAFGKREQTPETAAANADALVSAINNAVGPIVQTRDTLKTQVDDLANQVKAFDEASANGQLNAADIARKQSILQELAAKQTELSAVETQAQDAAISASNDALKQYAQAGEVPDFNAMGERLGINPDDLSSLYDQHSTSIKQQQAATDTRNKVASLIEANDTEGAQAFLEQNGFKQDQADVIMGDALKSIATKNKAINDKKAAEAKQQAKLDAATKLRAERDSELATILKTKPDASFANDVLPILQKKYKLQSGSEALSVWNEAKKQSKAAPVDQQADAAEVTNEERLNAKKVLYSLYKNKGYPDDVVASHVMGEQERANKDGAPRNIWESVSGAIGSSPASQKSPFKDGKLITTIHPEGKATADEQTPAIDNTQAIADELAQHVETKTRPDFIGLGKKYSAKPLDLDKQYREMLRVKKEQSKTVPPVAPVPGEAAPIVQPPPQPKQKAADRPVDPEKDSLLVALAKLGGLSRDEAISHGVDKAMLGHRPIFGKLLFRTDGKSFDSAAEALAQDNYPVFEDDQYNDAGLHGGNGRSHTGKALLLALTDALNGNDIGTPQYYVAKAQKAFEEEQEQARIDALFEGKGNSKADWLDEVSDAIVDELIENPSTATQEVIEVIQNDAGTEAQDVADNSTQEAGQQDNEGSAATSSRETTSQSEGGGREGTGGGKTDTKSIADNYKDFPVVAFHPTYGEIIEVPTTRGVNVRISRAEVERNISPTVKTFTKDGKLKEELHVLGNTLIGDKPLTDTAQQTKDMKEAGWTVAQKPSTRIQEFKLMQEGYSSYVPDGKGGFQEVGNDGFVWAKPPQKTTTGQQIADTKAPTPMSERANRHKAHIETDDGKHIYEGTTGDSSFHYLWNEDNDEVSLFRVKLLKNKDTGVVENHAISIVDPSTGKVIGHLTTGNKNLTDPTLIMSSTGLGSAVQHYAQDPATLTQSERDANVKDLTQKALAVRIKLQLLTPKAPTTNGQQIAEALDATATAIGAAAHQSAINRFKKEGGLTYRNPAAIEQVQKDERYNVEINTDGHAVVKGIKDGDAWVGVAPESQTERKEAQEIGDAEFDARMKELGYQEQEEIIDHVTAKGKTIRGVVRKGITKEEAKLIDPYSFAKDGGFFLREKYLTKAEPPKEEKKQEQLQGKVIAKKGIVISNDVGSDGWRVISDVKDTDTMIKVIQNEDMLSERILTMNMDMFKERLEQDTKRRSQYADQQELKQPEQAQDKPIKKDNGPYYGDGYSSFKRGEPRKLPSYFTSATGTNSKNWLKGWDAAKAEQAQNNTPTPVKQPEPRDLPNQDRLVGKNSEGKDLYEDSRGVRYFKQSGAKVYEGIAIGRNNSLGAIQREDEYRTVEEVAARQPKPQPKEEKPAPKQPSANTIFTEDAAAAARERLKKKLGGNRLNSGFDPEILQDGLILAGYHIEKGARTFAAFAKAIVEDMGDVVKPYIKSWYMGVKYDPRAANFDGMSSAAEVDSADIEAILKVSSQQPATPAPTAKGEIVDDYDENDLDASDGTEGWKYGGYIFGDDDVSYGVGYREIRKVKNNGTQVTIRQIRIYDENRASYMAVWEHESSKITDGILDGFSIDTAKFHFSMSDATENAFSNDATDGDALWTRFGREITDSIKYEMSREPKPNKAPKDKIGLPSPKQPTDKGDSNESQGNGSNSTRPLENVLPEGNQPTGKEGNTTTGGRGIGGANTTRNGRSNAGRSNRSGGVAAGQDSMDFEQPTQLDEQELAEEAEKVEDKTLPGQPRTPKKLTGVNPGNYRITEADKIGTGTPGERLKQNLEAIRLVRKLQEEGRYATKEEQAVLAKYVGWGGLANAFDEASKQKQYREANAELKRLLSPEEYTEALVSTQNAHYTSPKVIKAMYDLVRHLGFMGGNVLEPTVGSGNFIGLMPEDFAASSNWYAAELDPITGALAQYLYPEGQVMAGTGFQDAEFAYGKFDLAIGNPPFGDTRITDTNKARKHLTRMKIHNYIISKSGMHLRPGGVMAMVITHRFLDAKDDEARAELAKNFRFVGALRLPNTAFKENANTEVTTDIVIFQRLKPGEEATTNLEWLDTSAILKNDKGQDIRLNGYFAKHPKMMLGNPTLDGTLYAGGRGDEFTLEAIPGMDLEQAIADRIKTNLADQAGTMDNSAEYLEAASAGNMVNRADVGIGGFLFEGGKLSMRESDDANGNPVFVVLTPSTQWTEKTELGQKRYDRIIGMLHLRQQTIEMIALEMADAPVKLLDKHRALLNKSYDAFVKEHGFLADPANSKLMDGDIGLEFGLENSYQKALSVARAKATGMKPKPASAKKADILSRRVFTPHKVVTSAESARDGYLISLSEHGKLDIPYISELTGKTIKQVTDELSSGENPLIFMNPKTEKWEQHDEYLSGNVKVKHQEAVRAGLETNAKALEAVFPEDVKPNDLHITVRSGWLPVDHFVQFLDLLGVKNSKVSINAFTGTMFVTRGDETANALSEEFKNEDYDISEMLTNLANGRVLTAYDREPDGNGGYKRVVNKDRTAILSIQSKKMKELFNDWMRLDDGRMQEAAKAFNEKMNTHSTREYNGAKMLVTVGASPSIKLLNTQKNAAWRMIQSPVILLDHVVGAGKTFTLITGIMERRRLGLSRKPAMVVPNHLVGQWAKDFYALYPAAKLLAISEKDFAKSNRQRLFARMATGNFDCIIMGHSSLKFIQVSAATESKMINEEIAYLEKALAVASDSEDKRTVKSLANQISKKKERFKALADIKRDTLVEWEQMGIDYLGVDESHEFKNLEYSTSMQRVTGMNDPKGSQRAFDLYMKIRELRARGGGVAFATGTPISNSLVEMYTVLRYLNREELKSRGNDVFDAWVGTYGEVDSRIEYTATQKLKSRNVLARFGNLPELLQLYNEVADTVTMTNLKEIYAEQVRESNKLTGENKSEKMPIPPVKDGGRQLDVGNLTAAQSEYMDYLVARAESIEEQGGKNDPKIDNLLWISNDARKMSLDMRLVDPMAQDSPDSKVNRAANNIKRIYDDTHANKGTQLVFCDLSTPKKGADKEGKKIIKAALEKLGLDNDSRFARMMEDETLQIQWRMIMDRADNIIEDENTDDATRERIEDWLDKLDSDIEGILLTADSGFSVYDALKQTLVDKGIPENEIAFIHDYNSRDQKTELFGLVNDGSIRVLLGSSPKMGAGTNVQKRLVALHHMDAPWRPSDVEQREGRIIRQGNLFATPPSAENPNPLYDPNFEVEIKAYSTNRTFDTVMWQTLQRKAAMIEQFRSGEREMVEPNGDAAGYAEFMAQSTGNPAFKRKIEIEGELNGLQAQKRSYMARQGEASRFLEHYDQAKARALKSLEGHKDGSINSATYNGKTYANDYEAARLAEEAIYREEFDQWEIDDKEHGPLLLDYIKLSEEQKATAKKPKTPKKPAYPTIASKRMQAKSEWSQMVAKMMEDAEKNGEAKAKIYGDKELKLYREESNGEKTEWYLELGNVDIAYSISKTPNVGTIETGFMPNVMVNNLFRHRKNAENRIAELEESKPIAERVLAKPFPDQEKLESMEKEYEVVKDEVDSLAWSESKRRSLQVNRYIAGDKERQLTVKGGIDLVKHGNWRVIEKTINTKGKESVTTWVVVNKGDGAYKGQPTNNFATKQEAIAWAEKEQLENDPEGKPSPTRSTVNKTERMPPIGPYFSRRSNINDPDDWSATPRIQVAKELERLIAQSKDGAIDTEAVESLLDRVKAKQDDKNHNEAMKPRVRGYDWIVERLTRAKRLGELPADMVDMTLWFLAKNPDIANDLGLKLSKEKANQQYDGQYITGSRIMELVKQDTNSPLGAMLQQLSSQDTRNEVGVHELLHHTERMLPQNIRDGITKEWANAIIAERKKAAKEIDAEEYARLKNLDDVSPDKETFEATLKDTTWPKAAYYRLRAIDAIIEANAGSTQKLEAMFKDGTFDTKNYHLVNASEFWAVKGASIIAAKYRAKGFVRPVVQWLKGLYQQLRNIFGLSSDVPVMRGLNAVIKGDGQFVTTQMLQSNKGELQSRVDMHFKDVTKRTPELQEAAKKLKEGEITSEQYNDLVNAYKPVEPYKTVPKPETVEDMNNALTRPQTALLNSDIQDGENVGLRLDIPAYTKHGVWVASIHTGKADGKGGVAKDPISYRSTAFVANPQMGMKGGSALAIAMGSAKGTIATIGGQWVNHTTEENYELAKKALKDSAYIQVGMDPERHAYFYDRATMQPVVSGDEAIQIGGLVLVKNPVYAPASDFLFSRDAATGSGLTTAQVRTTLVDSLGEKTIKALEDKGLIIIHANVSAVPKQFDAKQGDQGFYDPNTGITHLIAENLNPETVLPTMLHEMGGHAGFQALLEPKLYDALMGTFNRLVEAGNPIAIEAQRRAQEAEKNKATQEMEKLPYLLTVAQQDIQASNLQKSAITKLIDRIISAVRAFAFEKLGVRLELTPNDMVALAERMIKALATQGVTTNEITVQPRVNDIRRLIKNVLSKGKERLSPSKEFMSVIDKAVNAEESNDARKEAPNIVSRFIGEMEKEVLELSQKTGEIGFRKTQDSPRLTVDAKEAAEQAEKTLNILKAHRKEIEDGIVFAVSAVESITGYKVKNLMVMMKKHSTIELLQGKKDSTNVDDVNFVNSSVSRVGRTIIKVNLNAQVLVDLTSKSTAIRASGINTIAHELTHLLQFERKNEQMVEPLGIDSFIPEGVASLHKTWLGEHYQVEEGGTNYKAEQEAFSVGYTAAKAMLKKEGLPLRIISESDLENMLLASARSATSVQQALYRFDKANYGQDIRFSRASNGQPSPSPTNPKLDRLLHGIGPGEKLYNALAQPIHKWLDDHSSSQWKLVNNMSPAFKQMMREYLRDQKASEEQTKNIVENGIAMSADERNLLSDVLEKMVASGTTIPQHIVQVAAAMRSALSGQTDELVRLGMLSEGSAERWRDTYLPRLYDKAAKDPINKALAKRLNIVGDHLKGRGIFREVEEKLEAKYEKLGWENRGKGKKGHVIMWRDYTYEERVKMGEIRDALHRFATGFLSTQRDIATGRLLEKIADNPDLASVDPVAGWTLVPTATIKETGGVKRYGKLSGMYVHPDVWENTKHYIDDRDGLMEFYRQTLSVWKQGKTALNVVAHMNNVVSNAVMVTAAGANMADVARGYDSIMKEDQYYKEAKELGMFASGHFTGDIRDYFGGEIQDATTPSNFVFKAFKAAWRNKGFEFMRKMYDAEDQLFRMSLYRKARELGATQAESIDYAETFMFNYADLPAGIKKIRDFGLPFISYTYKAVPAVTRLAFTQPHRVLALVGMVYAFNAIAYAMLGADADEDKERKNLPDYMQGYSAWGVPKLVRLPWNDGEKAAFLDVYRWAPLGDFFAIGNRTGGADMPTWAMMSGPYWSFYNTMIQNRNGLTGKNYLEDTDTDRQVFFKRMKFGLSEWVPMYYHVDKNLNAIRNALGDNSASRLLEGMGYTGTDMRGDPSELKNSLLGATGIKVRKLDMDDQQQRKLVALKSEMLDRVRQMRRIQRDKSNPYRERDIAAQKEEIKRIKEKAQEIRKQ